ncbi:MAG: hypothetical protein NTW56_18070 [Alphaproteobacteria bacterium]|nr:hypothetical protein [Alphaproteobacteria bacterium]
MLAPYSGASTGEGRARMAAIATRKILDGLYAPPDPAMALNPEMVID